MGYLWFNDIKVGRISIAVLPLLLVPPVSASGAEDTTFLDCFILCVYAAISLGVGFY